MMNPMSDHFRIGFRGEAIPQAFEFGAQHFVIFDDPVVHDGDAVAGNVRVGVVRGRDAVGRPAGVSDTYLTADRRRVERVLQTPHFADGSKAREPAIVDHSQTGRIVAAILEPAQTLHENRHRIAFGDDTHDSTHTGAPLAGLKRLPSVPEPVRKSSVRPPSASLLILFANYY